jgi:hypothetical protein
MPPSHRFLTLLLAAALPAGAASGTEGQPTAPAGPPPKIRQITLPNPVSDPLVLGNRAQLTPRPADGMVTQLPGVIEVRHESPQIGYAWDPVECRVLFVWKGPSMTGLIQVAEGPPPLSATSGVYGAPQYFGYRLVNGAPEFLYRLGKLAVEERLEPSADGSRLTQRWKVYQAEFDVMLAVPERWKDLVEANSGEWKGGFFKVPKAKAADLALTWKLGTPPALPDLPAAWTQALAALPPPPAPKPAETPPAPPEPAAPKPEAKPEPAAPAPEKPKPTPQ